MGTGVWSQVLNWSVRFPQSSTQGFHKHYGVSGVCGIPAKVLPCAEGITCSQNLYLEACNVSWGSLRRSLECFVGHVESGFQHSAVPSEVNFHCCCCQSRMNGLKFWKRCNLFYEFQTKSVRKICKIDFLVLCT